ncbi:MAG: hypothetical protein HOM21_13265, partial [Halobacteriovoraceae bacterium]|nr:hypothetical protein [Halobacteriovoraceae bacterium]
MKNSLFKLLLLLTLYSCSGVEKKLYSNQVLNMDEIKTVRIMGIGQSCALRFGKDGTQKKCTDIGIDVRNKQKVSWFKACNDLCIGDEYRLAYLSVKNEL